MAEYLACLDEIWTGDPAEFNGEFYKVPRGWSDPRPVQQPHPPVLLGGTAQAALLRAGGLAEGWISSSRFDIGDIPAAVETVRRGASEKGRDPDQVRIVIRGVARLRDEPDPDAGPLTGPIDVIRAGLEQVCGGRCDRGVPGPELRRGDRQPRGGRGTLESTSPTGSWTRSHPRVACTDA